MRLERREGARRRPSPPDSLWPFILWIFFLESNSWERTVPTWHGKINLVEGPVISLWLPHFFLRGGREKMGPGVVSHSREKLSLSFPLPFTLLPLPLFYQLSKISQGTHYLGKTPPALERPRWQAWLALGLYLLLHNCCVWIHLSWPWLWPYRKGERGRETYQAWITSKLPVQTKSGLHLSQPSLPGVHWEAYLVTKDIPLLPLTLCIY